MKNLFLAFTLILSFSASAQLDYDAGLQSIQDVKNGALIVRLYYQEDALEQLKLEGDMERYEKLKREIEVNNRAIRQAFANEYDFGPIYFMNARNSSALIRDEWDGILMDTEGNTVEVDICPYVVVDISESKRLGLQGLNAWKWVGEEWVHPNSPFPAFVNRYGGFLNLSNRSYSEMVEIFNARLRSRG